MNRFKTLKFTEKEIDELYQALRFDEQNDEEVVLVKINDKILPRIGTESATYDWMLLMKDRTIDECVEMIKLCATNLTIERQIRQTVNVTRHENKLVIEFRNHVCVISDDDISKETARRVFSWCKELGNNNISLSEVKYYEI